MRIIPLIAIALCVTAVAVAQTRAIDPEHSVMTVHVFRSGLFSVFAHNHEVRAPIASGSVNEQASAVTLSVNSGDLKVLDPDLSAQDRASVQQTMLSPQVLDVARFPQITFRSTRVEPLAGGKWRVDGELTLHGTTRPVSVSVAGGKGRYSGTATIKQREFGMKPVKIAGGTVSVKDEVRVDFQVALR